jgi:hypothetical protein
MSATCGRIPWKAPTQSIPNITVTFYGDCMKMCKKFTQTLVTEELAVAWRLHHLTTDFFFTRVNITVVLHPPYFSLFPLLKIKLKGCCSDTIEVTEAES